MFLLKPESMNTKTYKLEAVKLVRERGVTVAQAARDLDVHENVLRKWFGNTATIPTSGFLRRHCATGADRDPDGIRGRTCLAADPVRDARCLKRTTCPEFGPGRSFLKSRFSCRRSGYLR